MGNFAVIKDYLISIFLVLMPVAGMMLIFYSAYTLWRDVRGVERKKIRDRLREEDARRQAKKAEQSILKDTRNQSIFETILPKLSLTKKIDKWIEQTNVNFTATRFLMNIILASVIVLVAGILLKFPLWKVFLTAGGIFGLPIYVLRFMARRRMKILVNQLPDVFELISQALRAGHALASGVQLIGKQIPDPAGIEFSRVFHEQNLGIKIEEALSNFADRTDQLDIRFFVTAVLIQRQTGGDLAEVLDKIGEVIRDRIKIMGQVQALTAEGRMSGWVLAVMPFFVFLLAWVMNPEYAGILLYEPEGNIMLGAALFFEILGILMIRKIINIKV